MLSRDTFGEVEAKIAHMICSYAEKYNIPLEINLEDIYFYLTKVNNKVRYPSKEFWMLFLRN